jgi:hypothetical protein
MVSADDAGAAVGAVTDGRSVESDATAEPAAGAVTDDRSVEGDATAELAAWAATAAAASDEDDMLAGAIC